MGTQRALISLIREKRGVCSAAALLLRVDTSPGQVSSKCFSTVGFSRRHNLMRLPSAGKGRLIKLFNSLSHRVEGSLSERSL